MEKGQSKLLKCMLEFLSGLIKVLFGVIILEFLWFPMVLVFLFTVKYAGSVKAQMNVMKLESVTRWIFRILITVSLIYESLFFSNWYERVVVAIVVSAFMLRHEFSKENNLSQDRSRAWLNNSPIRKLDDDLHLFDFSVASVGIIITAICIIFNLSVAIGLLSRGIGAYLNILQNKYVFIVVVILTLTAMFNTWRTSAARA